MRSLQLTPFTLAMEAAAVRRMLKTWVALGNIFRVLLNLIRRSIFVMFKDSYLLPMFKQLSFIIHL